jgi:acetylornithine deacetylase/succinyl-diaminopimelate desuccinylase family protein
MMTQKKIYQALDDYIETHFDEQVLFLQSLVRVPTDTPPGNNTPHALHTQKLLTDLGFDADAYEVPEAIVHAAGLQSITNLVVRRRYPQAGKIIALNAHGDVVPPGDGWKHDPYGGQIADGKLYGRASAVSKCDFSTFAFATKAIESAGVPLSGGIDLLFTYDEEFGGELGPKWLLQHELTKPDLEIAAGFSYEVVTAHNGCLQMEATVHGKMGHAAVPETAIDALQAATKILSALYEENTRLQKIKSAVKGINCGYINVGQIFGGTNTNVVPGKVVLKIDRRMIPEENPDEVEAGLRKLIQTSGTTVLGITVDIKRLLLAHSMKPLPGNKPLVDALCRHASNLFGETIEASGTPLYTDARLFSERGIPAVIYGAGPRTVLESNAKRADEHIVLEDLRRATKVVARTLMDLLKA